ITSPSTRSPRNSSRSLDSRELALACVSARARSCLSRKTWPSFSSISAKFGSSVNDRKQPAEADGPRPFPDFPEIAVVGKEQEHRPAFDILRRNVTHFGAAVVG